MIILKMIMRLEPEEVLVLIVKVVQLVKRNITKKIERN